MSHPSIIAPAASTEESTGTITPSNQCSRIPVQRHDVSSLSLAETRRQVVVDIAVHVARIHGLYMLGVGV